VLNERGSALQRLHDHFEVGGAERLERLLRVRREAAEVCSVEQRTVGEYIVSARSAEPITE
jgi:hypothetical protein